MWETLSGTNSQSPLIKMHCCSVAKSCLTLWPDDYSTPGLPVPDWLWELAQVHVHWIGDAIQPSHPLLHSSPLPSIFPSIRIFSNESTLCIRWPKYWSFSFSISPSDEYSGLISLGLTGLISLQCTSYEMLGWMKYKVESRLPGEISITSDMQMTPPLWQQVKRN